MTTTFPLHYHHFLFIEPCSDIQQDMFTHPLMLLATEECLDIDFGDISNSESDLPKTSVILQLNPVSHILTVNFCILHIAL